MINWNIFRKKNGLTLIELLVVLVLSSILMAGLYRTFIGQQKTYTVQDQVADMQQNVRVAIDKMTREIRMAGFGGYDPAPGGSQALYYVLSQTGGVTDGVNGFTQVIKANSNNITLVGGFKQISTLPGGATTGQNQVTLAYATEASEFDGTAHHFISIGGIDSNVVQSRSGAILTLKTTLNNTHPVGTPVYKIQAITYNLGASDGKSVLRRNENTGGGAQTLAENIENLQFAYYDKDGNVTATIADIRMIKVTVLAKTKREDPDYNAYNVGNRFRRRELASFVKVRNMGL